MRILVYALCSLAIFKLFLDLLGGELVASYSVFVENVIFMIILAMIIRTYVKRRQGRRELLHRKINELNQKLSDLR